MKLVLAFVSVVAFASFAQTGDGRIYRCGNEYTNTVTEEQAKHCKPIAGANVTVIQAVKPAPARPPVSSSRGDASRPDAADQRAKEADARLILEAELKRAEAKGAELRKEYNNGEPEKLGPETRNHQKYLDRVAELKASISRNEGDIAGIKRELARLAPPAASGGAALGK